MVRIGKGTYTKRMPSSLNMPLNPLFNLFDVFLTILKILMHSSLIRIQEADFRSLAGFHRHAPGAVLDACCEIAREGVCVGGGEIHVFGAGWGVERIERVLGFVRGGKEGLGRDGPCSGLPRHRRPCDELSHGI
jgi:hypothetical protein